MICSSCGDDRPEKDFRGGRQCVTCLAQRRRARYLRRRDDILEISAAYREQHADAIRARKRAAYRKAVQDPGYRSREQQRKKEYQSRQDRPARLATRRSAYKKKKHPADGDYSVHLAMEVARGRQRVAAALSGQPYVQGSAYHTTIGVPYEVVREALLPHDWQWRFKVDPATADSIPAARRLLHWNNIAY